jgi:hypothetical protein
MTSSLDGRQDLSYSSFMKPGSQAMKKIWDDVRDDVSYEVWSIIVMPTIWARVSGPLVHHVVGTLNIHITREVG